MYKFTQCESMIGSSWMTSSHYFLLVNGSQLIEFIDFKIYFLSQLMNSDGSTVNPDKVSQEYSKSLP